MRDLAAIRNWIYSNSSAGVKNERYQRQLRDVEHFFTYVFDNNPDGISVLDRDLTIMGVNRAMEQWYPDQTPLRGQKCFAAYHGRSDPCVDCPSRRALETRQSIAGVVPYETGEGSDGTQELLAFPLFDDRNTVIGVIEYVRDISRLEDEERAITTLKTRLQLQDKTLQEQESALRVLFRQRVRDEANPALNIQSTIGHVVKPLLRRLEDRLGDPVSLGLVAEIRDALDGATSGLARRLASREYGFTGRELEIASCIVAGRTSKEIAASLGISPKAVSFHRANIRRKLGVAGTGENLRSRLIDISLS